MKPNPLASLNHFTIPFCLCPSDMSVHWISSLWRLLVIAEAEGGGETGLVQYMPFGNLCDPMCFGCADGRAFAMSVKSTPTPLVYTPAGLIHHGLECRAAANARSRKAV